MNCQKCYGPTRIYDVRERDYGNRLWRRRECAECGHRFSTIELAKDELEGEK